MAIPPFAVAGPCAQPVGAGAALTSGAAFWPAARQAQEQLAKFEGAQKERCPQTFSEVQRGADNWALLKDIVFVSRCPRTLRVVNRQRAVPDIAIKDMAIERAYLPIVGRQDLPGKIATDSEATKIGPNDKLFVRTELVSYTHADERIHPINRSRFRDPPVIF